MGKTVDVIMPANSVTFELRLLTQQTINSLVKSEPGITFNIFVIDGNKNAMGFKNAKTIIYDFPFNYNKCLNLGLNYCNAKNCILCNNDLKFDEGWLTKVLKAMGNKYLSASPNKVLSSAKAVIEGYGIAKELLGWCIVVKRKLFDIIGKLDESVSFWYSDNIYAEQLKSAGIKHILVINSRVVHLGSRTLRRVRNKYNITKEQRKVFDERKKIYNHSK